MSDAEIFARLKAGDMSACAACVQAHGDSLYRLALRLVRDPATAEDVVQETFLNAFKALDRFDGRSSLGTWLFRIAYNNALQKLRAARPVEPLEEQDEDVPPLSAPAIPWRETPHEVVARKETAQALDEAIDALPPSLRAVFILRDVEERSVAETAEILGLSEGAVKVRLHRARLALRDKLTAFFGEPAEAEPATLSCEEMLDTLAEYLDNPSDTTSDAGPRKHVATCPHCRILLDTTRQTVTLMREQGRRVVSTADREELQATLRAILARRECS